MLKIGVIGATGAVGREMVHDLEDCRIPEFELSLFASPRSAGQSTMCRGKAHRVAPFDLDVVRKLDVVLMSAGGDFSREWAKRICDNGGATIIDNSSAWRMDPSVPLVVPEVNASVLQGPKRPPIIANPNCAMIQLAVTLEPLQREFGIRSLHITTLQSVSGAGMKGMQELNRQVTEHYKFASLEHQVFPQPIAFNVIPCIGSLDAEGFCEEEVKVIQELNKVFGSPQWSTFVTTVRVPVLNGHSATVNVELARSVTIDEVKSLWQKTAGLESAFDATPAEIPTPRDVVGYRGVRVARLRQPRGLDTWLQYWCVADNLKKGAATNSVQILEHLVVK